MARTLKEIDGIRRQAVTPLALSSPLHSLRLLAGLSHLSLARLRQLSDVAVVNAERSGGRIQLDTLAAYAEAMGYRLVVGVVPAGLAKE